MRKSLARMLIIFLTVIVAVPALPVSAAEQSSSTAAVHYDHSSDQKIIQKIESLDTDSDGKTISVNTLPEDDISSQQAEKQRSDEGNTRSEISSQGA